MKKHDLQSPETLAIHAGQEPDPVYGGVSVPIYQSSTFAFASAEQGAARFAGTEKGFIYTRIANPTVRALEESLATLEGGFDASATATGMAAVTTIYTALLDKDAHVVGTASIYGPSRTVIENEFSRFGVRSDFVDTSDIRNVEKVLRPETKLLFVETPANPTLALTDLRACARIARERGITFVVDNTFLEPAPAESARLGGGHRDAQPDQVHQRPQRRRGRRDHRPRGGAPPAAPQGPRPHGRHDGSPPGLARVEGGPDAGAQGREEPGQRRPRSLPGWPPTPRSPG